MLQPATRWGCGPCHRGCAAGRVGVGPAIVGPAAGGPPHGGSPPAGLPARTARTARAAVWLAALAVAAGCGGASQPAAAPATLAELVEWEPEIRLEESDDVINVEPRVGLDPRGGFLVADAREAQLRRYDVRGALVRAFGGRGEGPGEFRSPTAAVRLRDGTILGIDRSGRYTQFDSAGGAILRTGRMPVSSVWDVDVLSDSTLLIAGVAPAGATGPKLHIWKPFSDDVEKSFFTPPFRRIGAYVSAAVGPGGIVATFGISDTVYIFGPDGTARARVPIRSERFRPYTAPESWPPPQGWEESFAIVEDAHWLGDGSVLLQYAFRRGGSPVWHILGLTLQGELRFELADVPRVLGTVDDGRGILFVAPGAVAPNAWRVGRVRGR